MADVLVLAEQQGGRFPKTTLVAVHAGLELASKRGGKCVAVVLGDSPDAGAAEIGKYGVAKVVALSHPNLKNYLADAYAQALAGLVKKTGAEFVLATATALGKDLMPRLAARLDAPMASEVTAINDDGTFVRPTYAGNAMATVELDGPVKVLTVRGTAFDAAKAGGSAAPVEKIAAELDIAALKMEFVAFNATKSDRPQLTEARIVISGGRGLKSGDNFKTVLEPLVDEMGAAMGASRAAVDAGFVPNDLQVGQTGKVVAPELYVAVGISGAIQHLAGMKD
ncbi:MAG: electron transfer flavoprotein subunit alpha/FixB family protein, partial [Candidatus Binataceae bacterium]